jgi:DNA-binding transcriptional LysR family regulator
MAGINVLDIGRLDLNLLTTLDVLLAEHNVTRAAERLHLSQPAVSVHLAHLREIFNDPLLLPGPRGMRPTTRADELRQPLREALSALQQAIAPSAGFDPAHATHTWHVAASDYSSATVLLPALARLRSQAPNTRVAVHSFAPEQISRQLELAEIDLAFHVASEVPPHLHRRTLFAERYVLVGRDGHPRLNRRPTPAQFCAMEHVIVSPDGGGFSGATDAALSGLGLSRRVVLSVPSFLFLQSVVVQTDLVAMLPERLARQCAGLRITSAPVEVPGFEMAMFWHERVHRDPAHQWLREQIASTLR